MNFNKEITPNSRTSPFIFGKSAIHAINHFNRQWIKKFNSYNNNSLIPFWQSGQHITNELRQQSEQCLPVKTFYQDIYTIAQCCLKNINWIPTELLTHYNTPAPIPTTCRAQSLPDLLENLPQSLHNILPLTQDKLILLLCSMADPLQFGTNLNRYPKQLSLLTSIVAELPDEPLNLIDFGCGVGLGTYELTYHLKKLGIKQINSTGITREPLEVWMAQSCTLPHDPKREKQFDQFKELREVYFKTGDILTYSTRKQYHLVICNGLIGGRFLNYNKDLQSCISLFKQILHPKGKILLANKFHKGTHKDLISFINIAKQNLWTVEGLLDNLVLSPTI